VTTTFLDYLFADIAEVPVIEHGRIETPGPGPGGYKGVGEAAPSVHPRHVNAVADARALRGHDPRPP
jgi:carbon-monoxide dehydrogenase large subunit